MARWTRAKFSLCPLTMLPIGRWVPLGVENRLTNRKDRIFECEAAGNWTRRFLLQSTEGLKTRQKRWIASSEVKDLSVNVYGCSPASLSSYTLYTVPSVCLYFYISHFQIADLFGNRKLSLRWSNQSFSFRLNPYKLIETYYPERSAVALNVISTAHTLTMTGRARNTTLSEFRFKRCFVNWNSIMIATTSGCTPETWWLWIKQMLFISLRCFTNKIGE